MSWHLETETKTTKNETKMPNAVKCRENGILEMTQKRFILGDNNTETRQRQLTSMQTFQILFLSLADFDSFHVCKELSLIGKAQYG
jgi:hypothetical protein